MEKGSHVNDVEDKYWRLYYVGVYSKGLIGPFLMVVAIKDLISKNIPMDSDTLYYSLSICIPFAKLLTSLDRI